MDSLEYLRILRRRWPVVVAIALLSGIGAALTAPPAAEIAAQTTFNATHTLYRDPASSDQSISLPTVALLTTLGEVPRRAAEALGSSEDPAALASRVSATSDPTLGTVQIAVTDRNGEQAARTANAFAEETLRFFDERTQIRETETIDRLSRILDDQEARIRELDSQLTSLIGTLPPPDPAATVPDPFSDNIDVELLRAERDALIRTYGITVEQFQQATAIQVGGAGLVTLQSATPIPVATDGFAVPSGRGGRFLVGLAIGGLIGLAVAVFLDRTDTRIRTRRSAESAFRLPVVAEVPRVPAAARASHAIITAERPASFAAESYRILRLAVQLAPKWTPRSSESLDGVGTPQPIKRTDVTQSTVVLVTSAGPAEGKSTTVANLATAFAEVGKSVLVIDCDFRHAEQHRYFEVGRAPGVSDYLSANGQKPHLGALVQPTAVNHALLIPNGRVIDNPGQLLGPEQDLISAARKLADVVIIDAGPLLAVNDPAALMPYVDAVVVTARSGRTHADAANRTADLLARLDAPVVGVCLVSVPRGLSGHPYYAQLRSVPHDLGRPVRPTTRSDQAKSRNEGQLTSDRRGRPVPLVDDRIDAFNSAAHPRRQVRPRPPAAVRPIDVPPPPE